MSTLRKIFILFDNSGIKYDLEVSGVIFLVILMGALEVAGIASIMPFIAVLIDPESITTSKLFLKFQELFLYNLEMSASNLVIIFGIFSGGVLFLTITIRVVTNYKLNTYIENCRHNISSDLLRKYLYCDYSFIIDNNSAKIRKAVLSEVDQFISNVYRPVVLMFSYAVVATFVLILLTIYNWVITLVIALSFGASYLLLYYLIQKNLNDIGDETVVLNEQRFKQAGEATSGIRVIQIMGVEDKFSEYFESISKKFSRACALRQSYMVIPNDLIELLAFGSAILSITLFVISTNVSSEAVLSEIFAPLSVFALAAYRLKPAAFNIATGISSLKFGGPILHSLINLQKELTKKISVKPSGSKIPIFSELKLERFSFQYPGNSTPLFSDQTLEIKKGDVLGIIGSSGSGKSTLINLLVGLLAPSSGKLSVNSTLIEEGDIRKLGGLFGYVPQEVFITDGNFYENVAFGVAPGDVDKCKVREVCKLAKIHEFILDNDPLGYDAELGEGGIRISGGQRQRLAIARALYRKPHVLILDEGTSGLDEFTEAEILSSIHSLNDRITVVMVTHRHNTLSICNKVVKIQNGHLTLLTKQLSGNWK